jgi:hypothetical protein
MTNEQQDKPQAAPVKPLVGCGEITVKKAIVVTPKKSNRIDWSNTTYRIEIDTDPDYEDLDFPIILIFANGKPLSIEFEPEDAEAVGHALIRAAAIRRAAFASNADFTGPTTGLAPETGVAGSGANPC